MATKFVFPRSGRFLDRDLGRLVVHLEHISEAAALLRARGVVRERMALVAADHLAEVLLQDCMEATFVTTEQLGPVTPRRYNRVQRQQLVNDFSARVQLACEVPVGWGSEPWLDARDASVFRVAHAYRNALYHGDRHNVALGRSLTVAYLQAVGRTLVRSWPRGHTFGGLASTDRRIRAFRRLGATVGSSFSPRAVAEDCVGNLIGSFRVQRATLCRQLVSDLEDRALAVEATVEGLSRSGLRREIQRDLVRAALLWAAFRADPELVRLQDEKDTLLQSFGERAGGPADDVVEAYKANQSAIERRREALSEVFRAPVTIATAGRMSQSARKLASAEDTVALLERYRTLDERFALLEQAVASVDIEWDRMVQHELDLARGK